MWISTQTAVFMQTREGKDFFYCIFIISSLYAEGVRNAITPGEPYSGTTPPQTSVLSKIPKEPPEELKLTLVSIHKITLSPRLITGLDSVH